MSDRNMSILEGRIASVSIKTVNNNTPNEDQVANFSLRYERRRKIEGSDDYETADAFWMRCEAWGRAAEDVARLQNGQIVRIAGEMRSEEPYTDRDGVRHEPGVRIRVDSVTLALRDLEKFELRERKGQRESEHAPA